MGKRKNLVHEKIKRAKPNDLVAFQVRLPAYLLSDVKRYGDSTKFIRTALELAQKKKFKFGLLEIISDLRKQIELLELWQNSEQDENSKMDEEHLLLLETYRYTYFCLNPLKSWTKFEKQFCNNLILGYEKHKTKIYTGRSFIDYSGSTT